MAAAPRHHLRQCLTSPGPQPIPDITRDVPLRSLGSRTGVAADDDNVVDGIRIDALSVTTFT